MPFVSERQRRFLYARHPEIARRWAEKYGNRIRKNIKVLRKLREAGKKMARA